MKRHFSSLAVAASLCLQFPALAQTFVPPMAYGDRYPILTPGLFQNPATSSCYADAHVNSPYGDAALYLSGWSGSSGGNGFAWRFTLPNDPSVILAQGTVPYPNGRDIEVGLVHSSGDPKIFVAYYQAGVGHRLDEYKIWPAVTLVNTTVLSSATTYGRISMDCHDDRELAICWESSTTGTLQAVAIEPGVGSGPIVNIPNPSMFQSYIEPDIAFSHVVFSEMIHFVAFLPAGFTGSHELTKFSISWSDLRAGSIGAGPSGGMWIDDHNILPASISVAPRPVIDAPDHYDVPNWAYTYTVDGSEVNVRLLNGHSSWTPVTRTINDGSIGSASTIPVFRSQMPALAYSDDGNDMYVAWYLSDGLGSNSYITLNITEEGNAVLNLPDYLLLPNGTAPAVYSGTPGISLNKMNWDNPDFLYAAYYDMSAMNHAYHRWADPFFKAANPGLEGALAGRNVRVFPSPFTDNLNVTLDVVNDGIVQLQLTDISGKLVYQSQHTVSKGNAVLKAAGLGNLLPGMYLLTVWVNNQKTTTFKVLRQ